MSRSGTGRASGAIATIWPALPATAFVVAGFVWPMARLCARSFSTAGEGRSAIVLVFVKPFYRRALLDLIGLSLAVAATSVLLCLPPALALARGRFRGRALLRGAFAVPLSLSGIVIGFLAIAMLGNVGALPILFHAPSLAGMAYGLSGLFIAYLYFEVPRATLTMEAALAQIDEGLLEAARTLGARPHQVLFRVFLPLVSPAMRSAFAVTFAASLGSFGVALILSARFPLLPVELYRAFTGLPDDAPAAAMSLVLAATGILVLALTGWRRT